MLVSSGHVLRIPDNRPFDTYEHKTPLLAISETWGSAAGHNHVVGRQGLCYTISRDYFGYGRSVHAIRRHLKKIYSARRRDVVAGGTHSVRGVRRALVRQGARHDGVLRWVQ